MGRVVAEIKYRNSKLEFINIPDSYEGKRCISCGKFVNKNRQILPNTEKFKNGHRPICVNCE